MLALHKVGSTRWEIYLGYIQRFCDNRLFKLLLFMSMTHTYLGHQSVLFHLKDIQLQEIDYTYQDL